MVCAGLLGRKIKTAELQKLTVMAEAAKIACLGEDGHGIDGSNAGDHARGLVIAVFGQNGMRRSLELVALPDRTTRSCRRACRNVKPQDSRYERRTAGRGRSMALRVCAKGVI